MSFDAEIRASLDPNSLMKILHRTVWRSEAVREVKDSLEGHVHKIPFAVDLADAYTENFNDGNVVRGAFVPYEPSSIDSYVYQNFNSPYGTGQKNDITVNTTAYDRIPIPDQGFLGSNFTFQYYVLDGTDSWLYVRNVPPVQKLGWSVGLNQNGNTKQMIGFDSFGTVFDWTAQNFSEQFWLYPTDLSDSGANRIIKHYTVDASNAYTIEIDRTDNKILIDFDKATVHTKIQSPAALTLNAWNHIAYTWVNSPAALVGRLNDVAFVSSSKTGLGPVTAASARPTYGSYGGAASNRDYEGYIGYMIYYKHTTVLTTAEMTNLYNNGTKYNVVGKRPYRIPYVLLSQT